MGTTELPGEPRDWGSLVIRLLGVLLVASGLHGAYTGVRDLTSGFHGLVSASAEPAQFIVVLGHWPVYGGWRHVEAALNCIVQIFAGIQLVRLRRSGWIAALIALGYTTLTLAFWLGSGQLQRIFEDAYSTHGPESIVVTVLVERDQYKIDHSNRIAEFVLACYALPLIYLASEWWRFWGKRGWYAAPRVSYAKALICIVLLAMVGVWTLWGAEHMLEHSILRAARSPHPQITSSDVARLSLRAKRELNAILIRRLVAERTDELARIVQNVNCTEDISFLNAEDIPAILSAARSARVEVREGCYRLLGEIGTKEGETCLREAVDGKRDTAWDVAVGSLRELYPSTAPEALLKAASEKSDGRKFLLRELGSFEDARAVPILCEALNDANPEIRSAAISGLGGHPSGESERALLSELDDKEIWLRGDACMALFKIGTEKSAAELIAVLNGAPDTYRNRYQEKPDSLHGWAAYALQGITGEDFGNDAAQWEKWWNEAGPRFDMEKSLAARLLKPLPPPPEQAPKSPEDFATYPYFKATSTKDRAIREIWYHNMRSLAGELARYMELPERQAPLKLIPAQVLTNWGYREGIEWMIEYVDNDSAEGARMFAIRALGRACGVNFFSDKKRWREWWLENRQRFASAAPG